MSYKLGSLFDGSGGFPLAGSLCGIEPVWAAEIEPYPIAVTRSRFPSMKHLGSVTDIHGGEIEPVDIITFGSPCQDLSVAGKRAGLKHEANGDEETTRSGLFMEAVRIIKEMREATNGEYPSFALWENVPGAFSSQKGEDFRVVLEELIRIVEPNASVPPVPKAGWAYADSYIGDGWSLAYRVFDAQYWGVPQRRRRIHLVLDLRGERAREVLFEREGVRGYFAQGGTPWQGTAADSQGGSAPDDREGENEGREAADVKAYSFDSLSSNSMKSKNPHSGCREVETAKTLDTFDPNPSKNQGGIAVVESVPYTLKIRSGCEGGGKGALIQTDKSATLATNNDQYLFQPRLMDAYQHHGWRENDNCGTLTAGQNDSVRGDTPLIIEAKDSEEQYLFENHSQDARYKGPLDICPMLPAQLGTGGNNQPFVVKRKPVIFDGANVTSPVNASNPQPGDPCHTLSTDSRNYAVYCLQGNGIDRADTAGCNGRGWREGASYTLNTLDRPAVAYGVGARNATEYPESTGALQHACYKTLNANGVIRVQYIVRRLTPTECARLQGFADRWGDIDKKDDFTEDEYQFWLNVRNLHAAINGRATKEYAKAQMLKWYNGLHTDSAEYKLWGNGIALPPALYCMQGMTDALYREEAERMCK